MILYKWRSEPLEIIGIFQNLTNILQTPLDLPILLSLARPKEQIGNNFNLLKSARNFMYRQVWRLKILHGDYFPSVYS